MTSQRFRKLDINLPRQPLVNQSPWLVAGLLLALAIILMSASAYLYSKKSQNFPAGKNSKIKLNN